MGVSETRIKVRLIDGLTSGMGKMTSANERFMASMKGNGGQLSKLNASMGGLTTGMGRMTAANERFLRSVRGGGFQLSRFNANMDSGRVSGYSSSLANASKNAEAMNRTMNRLAYSVARYAVVYRGLAAIGDVWNGAIGGAFEYAKSMETNELGISAILSSMTKLNGKTLEWSQASGIAANTMKYLQSESLKTAATAEELISTFRAILGPGLAGGMTYHEVEQFSVVGATAVKTLGLPSNQVVQELRDLVQGGIRPADSTLATALGLTDKDIKAAKQSSEGLFKFLMSRMQGFELAKDKAQDTMMGKLAQIKEGTVRGIAEGGRQVFDYYKQQLGLLSDNIIQVQERTNELGQTFYEWNINPKFISTVEGVGKSTILLVENLKKVGETAMPVLSIGAGALGGVANNVISNIGAIAGVFAGIKTLKYGLDLFGSLSKSYEAQTKLGKGVQALKAKITGMADAQEKAAMAADAYARAIDGAYANMAEMDHMRAMVDNNANSVTNLSKKWQEMGMAAKRAEEMQAHVIGKVQSGKMNEAVEAMIVGDEFANFSKQQADEARRVSEAYKAQIDVIRNVVVEERNKFNEVKRLLNQQTAEIKSVTAGIPGVSKSKGFVNQLLGDKEMTDQAKGQIKSLIKAVKALGIEEEKCYQYAGAFGKAIRDGADVHVAYEQAYQSAKLYKDVLSGINGEAQRLSKAQINVRSFLINTSNAEDLRNRVASLVKEFEKIGLSEEHAAEMANEFVTALKRIDTTNLVSVENVQNRIIEAAKTYKAETMRVEAQKKREIEVSRRLALETTAAYNAYRVGGEGAYQAIKNLIAQEKALKAALVERGLSSEEVNKRTIAMLNQVANATKKSELAAMRSVQATMKQEEAQLGLAKSGKALTGVTNRMIAGVSELSFAVSVGGDVLAQADEKNRSFYEGLSQTAFRATMLTGAISGTIGVLKDFIPALGKAWAALKTASIGALGLSSAIGALGLSVVSFIGYKIKQGFDWQTKYDKGEATLMDLPGDNEVMSKVREFAPTVEADVKKIPIDPEFIKKARAIEERKRLANESPQERAMREAKEQIEKQEEENKKLLEEIKGLTFNGGGGSSGTGNTGSHAPKVHLENMELPVGTKVIEEAGKHVGEYWGPLMCATFASSALEAAGITDISSANVEEMIRLAGDSYHPAGDGYTPQAGDVIVWTGENFEGSAHAGIADNKGGYFAHDNHGIVHQGDYNNGWYGNYQGVISIAQHTHGATYMKEMAKEERKQYERKQKQAEMYARINGLVVDFQKETRKANGDVTAYEEVMDGAHAKIAQYWDDIVKAQNLGIDTSKLTAGLNEYLHAMERVANVKKIEENMSLKDMAIRHTENMALTGEGTIEEQRLQLETQLQNYREYLEETLTLTTLNAKERASVEEKYISIIQRQQEMANNTMRGGLRAAMVEITQAQVDFKQSFLEIKSEIFNAGVEILSGAKSLTGRLSDMFKNLANMVLKMASQVIMNGLLRKLVGGFGLPGFAAGGVARPGLAVVGEYGPELVHVGSTSRVFNNKESRGLMSGGGQNIKIEIKNESGTPVKAEQQGGHFDGETYVLGVVLKGIAENKMGMRSALKGMAMA